MEVLTHLAAIIIGLVLGLALARSAPVRLREGQWGRRQREMQVHLVRAASPGAEPQADEAPEPLCVASVVHPNDLKDRTLSALPLSDGAKWSLSSLVSQLPSIGMGGVVASSNVVLLSFSPSAQAGLADGTLTLMGASGGGFRAIAVDSQNRIAAHGTFSSANLLRTAAAVTAVWQVLGTITAQKFLKDMNLRLAKIETGVNELLRWQESARLSALIGSLEYLRSLYEALSGHVLAAAELTAVHGQLEQIDREARQLFGLFRGFAHEEAEKFKGLKLDGVGLKENAGSAIGSVRKFRRDSKALLLAAHVRWACSQVRLAMSPGSPLAGQRLSEIKGVLSEFAADRTSFQSIVKDRLPELQGFWSSAETDQKHQKQLEEYLTEATQDLDQLASTVREAVMQSESAIDALRFEAGKPLELVINRDGEGRVTEVHRLSTPTA